MELEAIIKEIKEGKIKVEGFSELININTKGLLVGSKIFIEVIDDKIIRAYTKLSTVTNLTEEKEFWNKEYNEGRRLHCTNWELREHFKRY